MKHLASPRAGAVGYCGILLSALVLPTGAYAAPVEEPTSLLGRMFPLTGRADWLSASYYVTSQSYYDIEVETIDLGRAWRLGNILELQGRLGAFHSEGERVDAPWLTSQNSRTSGVTFGGATRFYAPQTPYARLFIEGAVEILYTPGGEQFPAGGTGVNAFLRVGGGLQCQITARLALEAHYEYAHVSNGAGSVEQNPMWNGRGGGLTLRRWL